MNEWSVESCNCLFVGTNRVIDFFACGFHVPCIQLDTYCVSVSGPPGVWFRSKVSYRTILSIKNGRYSNVHACKSQTWFSSV